MHKLKSMRGSLLFETLIALLVLAVGIGSLTRLFAQTLYVSDRNFNQLRARRYLESRLFSFYSGVDPAAAGSGKIKEEIPVKPQEKPLIFEMDLMPLQGNAASEAVGNTIGRNQYSHAKLRVLGSREDSIINSETVVSGIS